MHKTKNDVFNEEIQRFDTKYGKGNALEDEGLLTGLRDSFNVPNCHMFITSD
jgi:hypothetical protein